MAIRGPATDRIDGRQTNEQSQLTRFTHEDTEAPPEMAYSDDSISNQLATEYLEVREGRQLTTSSAETYESQLQEYIRFLRDRGKTLLDATRGDVIEYIERCVDRGNRTSTIRGKLTTISELYTFIFLRTEHGDELAVNPLELQVIDLSSYNTPPDIEREALSREEIRRLFDAMDSYRNRLIVIVAVETGLRNSDIRNLRVDDVNLRKKSLYVRDPKNSRPYTVPVSGELATELEEWINAFRGGYADQGTNYLFLSQHGGQLATNGGLNTIIKEAAEEAGIQKTIGKSRISDEQREALNTKKQYREWKRVTPHTLRHTCLTLMKEEGVPLPYRQLVANHRDPVTTQGYSHGQEEEFERIREQFDSPI